MLTDIDAHPPTTINGLDLTSFQTSVIVPQSQPSAVQYGWSEDLVKVADWVQELTADDLPRELCLYPGYTVVDPEMFLARFRLDIQAGPDGPRARTGSLQADMLRLREILLGRLPAEGLNDQSVYLPNNQTTSSTQGDTSSDSCIERTWVPRYPSGPMRGKRVEDCPTRFLVWDLTKDAYRNWQLRAAVVDELRRRSADPNEPSQNEIEVALELHDAGLTKQVREENERERGI